MNKLLKFIGNPNVASEIDDDTLKKLGDKVVEDYQADRDSMSEWSAAVESGLKVAKMDDVEKSFPWQGASNYKSPMIFSAVWKFGDRATVELLANKNLVKVSLEGEQVPENISRKNRVAKHMNWQFNYEMENWREQQERLFYELACIGVVFKKTFFDPAEGCNVSRVIHYPNFAVNNETSVAGELGRFTECKDYSANEVQSFIASDVWIEFDVEDEDDRKDEINESDADEESKEHVKDVFIEQHTCYDLDDDGYAEPYIVTVHKPTCKVVRIVALYDESSIYVKVGKGQVAKFEQALNQRMQGLALEKQQEIIAELQAAANGGEIEEINPEEFIEEMREEALSSLKVIKIKPTNLITDYSFVPDPEGKYLSWGFCHILASYAKGVNTTTNQLIDAGTLANVPGGFMSSEFRGDRSPAKIKPGHFNKVDVPASVLANGLRYFEFKGADPSLMQLNEGMKGEAADVASVVNLQDAIAPNAPAATTLGILQEKLMPTTALLRRVLSSMSKEFRIMAELNYRYVDPMTYQQVTDEQADYRADYEMISQDIQPTASNAMTNATQKMQTATVLSSEVPNIIQSGGDIRPIMSFLFEGLGAEDLFNKVYPDPNSMSPEQKAALQQQQQLQQQMLQQQQIANQLQQASLEEQQLKNQLKQFELQIKETEAQTKQSEVMAKMQERAAQLQIDLAEQQIDAAVAEAEIENTLAQAEKYRAEANSTVVTTQVDALTKQLEFIRSNLTRFN